MLDRRSFLACLLVIGNTFSCSFLYQDNGPARAATTNTVKSKCVRLGDYLLRVFIDDNIGVQPCGFELSRKGRIEYHRDSHTEERTRGSYAQYTFVDPHHLQGKGIEEANPEAFSDGPTIVATDINNDGVPVLIVKAWTGGNGFGSIQDIIIQLGKQGPKEIYFGDPCKFKRQTNGKYEIISTVLYCGGACQPDGVYIDVPLFWNGSSYRTSTKLLAKSRPTPSQLRARAARIRKELQGEEVDKTRSARFVNGYVVTEIVSLIFSGNWQSAHKLVQLIYPGSGKIRVEAQIGDFLDWGEVTPTELWNSIVSGLTERVSDKSACEPGCANIMPVVKKLNPDLFH